MSAPARRFWTKAEAVATEDGWTVALDGRPIRTPAAAPFRAPTEQLARAVAAEWDAQPDRPDPARLPLTRAVNTALDRVAPQRAKVAEAVAAYAASDLLCHRAPHPRELIDRQTALWDPPLAWAAERHGARLILAEGVMPVDQPPEAVAALARAVADLDAFRLTALHELTALSGSLVLALAVADGALSAEDAWDRAVLDETFQAEQWGDDAEALAARAARRAAFLAARDFLDLL